MSWPDYRNPEVGGLKGGGSDLRMDLATEWASFHAPVVLANHFLGAAPEDVGHLLKVGNDFRVYSLSYQRWFVVEWKTWLAGMSGSSGLLEDGFEVRANGRNQVSYPAEH